MAELHDEVTRVVQILPLETEVSAIVAYNIAIIACIQTYRRQ